MKNAITLLCFIVSLVGYTQNEANIAAKMLDTWHKAAASADFQNYFSKMTEDAIFIGTDPTENWNKTEFKSFSKPYFDKGKAWEFIPFERHVYVQNNFAWFDELLNSKHMGICRGSGVLIKVNGQWLVKHYVLSLSIPNENMKEIVPLKAKFEEKLLEKSNE